MLRVTVVVAQDALEDLYDVLMPLLPGGAFERELAEDRIELTFAADTGEEQLRAAAGELVLEWKAEDSDIDLRDMGRMRAWTFGERVVVRSPLAPAAAEGMIDVVIERLEGTFGTGQHPTTRASLELLVGIEPGGDFADLGCGTGVLAVVAAKLGFEPVYACDHEPQSVKAALHNAALNDVTLTAELRDLLVESIPLARTVVANVPYPVHERLAALLPAQVEHVILSGIEPHENLLARELYGATGMRLARDLSYVGWPSLHYERA